MKMERKWETSSEACWYFNTSLYLYDQTNCRYVCLRHPCKIIYVHNRHLWCCRCFCSKGCQWFVSSLIMSLAKPKIIQRSQWKSLVYMFYEPHDKEAKQNTWVISYLGVELVLFYVPLSRFCWKERVSTSDTLYNSHWSPDFLLCSCHDNHCH